MKSVETDMGAAKTFLKSTSSYLTTSVIIHNYYKYIIECSQTLEKYIENNLQGKGKGLHEKVTSIEDELSEKDIKNFRFIATARNQMVHEGKMTCEPREIEKVFQQLELKYNLN